MARGLNVEGGYTFFMNRLQDCSAWENNCVDTKPKVMQRRWKNKRNMYSVVLFTCKKYQATWANLPAFENTVNQLENKLNEFAQIAEERLEDTTNITKNKDIMVNHLHEKVYSVVRIIEAYALNEGLDKLAMEYSITKGSLIEGGAKATINKFSNVLKKATELASDLEDFGCTPQFLQTFTQEVENTRKVILKPRIVIIKRKMLNRRLEQLIGEIDVLVYKQLSSMLRILQFDHPAFFDEFMDARNIIDTRGPRRSNASTLQVENESPPLQNGGDIANSA